MLACFRVSGRMSYIGYNGTTLQLMVPILGNSTLKLMEVSEANKSALLFESETTVPSVVTSGGNAECSLKLLLNEFKVDQKILLSLGLFSSLLV